MTAVLTGLHERATTALVSRQTRAARVLVILAQRGPLYVHELTLALGPLAGRGYRLQKAEGRVRELLHHMRADGRVHGELVSVAGGKRLWRFGLPPASTTATTMEGQQLGPGGARCSAQRSSVGSAR